MIRKAVIVSRLAPWPSDTGAFKYTAMLAEQIASCADETILVAAEHPRSCVVAPYDIKQVSSPAVKATALGYLVSGLPFAAVPFSTPKMRQQLAVAIEGADLVVLDHIGSAWALDSVLASKAFGARLVYIAHNVESDTRRSAIASGGIRAIFARFDALRIDRIEARLLRRMHAVICISSEDSIRFSELGAEAQLVTINPIRPFTANFSNIRSKTSRRIVLVGSFHWRAKQMNLWSFLAARAADENARAIALRVVGSIPEKFLNQVKREFPDVEITGAVARIEDYLDDCRIGVIPEQEGGGFKLKAIDYVSAGLPIFGIDVGLRGLPLNDGTSMRSFSTMTALWRGIVQAIDDVAQLENLRQQAHTAFERYAEAAHIADQLSQALTGHGEI